MFEKIKNLKNTTVTEFMTGRYGYDQLSKFLMILGMIMLVVTGLMQGKTIGMMAYSKYMYLLALIVLGFGYYRMASKKIAKRKKENDAYMRFIAKFSKKAQMQLEKEEKVRKYATFEVSEELAEDGETVEVCYRCRKCSTELRYKKDSGIVKVICPNCGASLVDRA